MIEFTGFLTGAAEKYFIQKGKVIGRNLLLAGAILFAPVVIALSLQMKTLLVLYIYLLGLAASLVISLLPKSKKEQAAFTPKRIYTDGESITTVADKYVETKFIEDVKAVYDYGAFYELTFPFGKISEKFICQKDLLTKGTLEEFESLFGDKLIRK